jgi:hypothetical protein
VRANLFRVLARREQSACDGWVTIGVTEKVMGVDLLDAAQQWMTAARTAITLGREAAALLPKGKDREAAEKAFDEAETATRVADASWRRGSDTSSATASSRPGSCSARALILRLPIQR